MKKIIAFIVAILICLPLYSCTGSTATKVSDFDNLVELILKDSENVDDEIDELFDKLKLDPDNEKCSIDEKFITEYLKTHTKETLINNLYIISDEIYNVYYDEFEIFNKIKPVVLLTLNMTGMEIKKIDPTKSDTEGYYTKNSERFPKHQTFEREGKFYNSTGENVSYDTRTCTIEYTYYGDFAIRHSQGYSYDSGRYEWVNGVFYDELPSWEPYDDYDLECRGYSVLLDNTSNKESFFYNINTLTYITVDDCTYLIYNNAYQNYGKVWKKFENNDYIDMRQ